MPTMTLERSGGESTDAVVRTRSPFAPDSLRLAAERACDGAKVEALVDRAFGPGRFAKAAERVREGAALRLDLSVCAWRGDTLLGSVRLWSARIGVTPVLFLGPIAVETSERGHGVATAMVRRACDCAQSTPSAGARLVVLVGEIGLFGPLGFAPIPYGVVVLPGPVDARRVLWKAFEGGLEGVCGPLLGVRQAI